MRATNYDTLPIIVPYRNREEHLRTFVSYMEQFLIGRPFRIVVVHQSDERPFNRGQLLNIGFQYVCNESKAVCFHDVDMLPVNEMCDYSTPETTTHLAGCTEQYDFAMPFPEYFGGVMTAPITEFVKVNGFSNQYWGWGEEDCDLWLRYVIAGIPIHRKPGVYLSLPHPPSPTHVENTVRIKRTLRQALEATNDAGLCDRFQQVLDCFSKFPDPDAANESEADGVTTVRYTLLNRCSLSTGFDFESPISSEHELLSVSLE